MTGMTRYGAVSRKVRENAVSDAAYMHDTDPDTNGLQDDGDGGGELGAFAFGVTAETVRAHHVATAGNAYYEGGTLAVDQAGTHYSGDISLRVRFATNRVDGLITNLMSADGDPWVHLFDDVSSINLPTATMANTGIFSAIDDPDGTRKMAEISYAFRAGGARATELASSWRGRLLGRGSDAGYQAVGAWSVGENHAASSYLAGGFGAERTSDEPDRRPALDDGTNVKAKLLGDGGTFADNTSGAGGLGMTALADGKLTITVAKFGWIRDAADEPAGAHTWTRLDDGDTETTDVTTDATTKYEVNLASLLAKAGVEFNMNGDIHRAVARTMIEAERKKLAVLIDTDQLAASQMAIWQRVQEILWTRVFNGAATPTAATDDPVFAGLIPEKVHGAYDKDTALETIDNIIMALSSASNLEAALDKDETALFVNDDDVPFSTRGSGDIFGEKELQVKAWSGSTDFTRFGVWRVRRTRNALRQGGWVNGEKDSFAYSPLAATKITAVNAPNYPTGATATYSGSTVAFVGNAGYEGDVSVRVVWGADGDAATIDATVQTVISNLQNVNGDLYAVSGSDVRELVFANVTMTVTDDDLADFATTSGDITVHYVDRATATTTLTITTHDGQFVGSSSDGPLGLIGRYATDTITGAYGADLP